MTQSTSHELEVFIGTHAAQWLPSRHTGHGVGVREVSDGGGVGVGWPGVAGRSGGHLDDVREILWQVVACVACVH